MISLVARALLAAGATTPLAAASRAQIVDTATTKFAVAGIPVLLRRVTSNEVVTANVYLLGGVRQVTDATEGIEPFLLDVSEHGTQHASTDALRRAMAQLGTQINIDPDVDWTAFGVRATTQTFERTWAVMADRLMFPKLDNADVELVRQQYLSAVRQRGDSPDALVEYLADSVAYAGHPYGRSLIGTERSLRGFTPAMLKRYETTQVLRSRILVVVVGNVTRPRVEKLIGETLGRLPVGTYHWTIPQAPADRESSSPVEVPRDLPTNYILGYYRGPPASSADYQVLRIAAAALSGRFFSEVRSRRNLSYAVSAPFVDHAVAAGGLYVTTESPDTTLRIMRHEVEALQSGFLDPAALERLVQAFITEYFLDNETNADQANFLARAQLYRGDYRAADHFVDELRKVTPSDVRRVAERYMNHVAFAYVGDTAKVSRELLSGF